MAWNEERVERLKKMWGEGQSASQIAKELGGVTRNAVIGKVHRLGLSKRAGVAAPKPEKKPAESPEMNTAPKSEVKVVEVSVPPRKLIVPAERPLPPQPSANEVSAEALASHREVQEKALRLGLMELTERTCKWPFGDPATEDFWFCGLPVEAGKAYCKPCAEVAYQKPVARRDRRR